jgi:hypothetical protein
MEGGASSEDGASVEAGVLQSFFERLRRDFTADGVLRLLASNCLFGPSGSGSLEYEASARTLRALKERLCSSPSDQMLRDRSLEMAEQLEYNCSPDLLQSILSTGTLDSVLQDPSKIAKSVSVGSPASPTATTSVDLAKPCSGTVVRPKTISTHGGATIVPMPAHQRYPNAKRFECVNAGTCGCTDKCQVELTDGQVLYQCMQCRHLKPVGTNGGAQKQCVLCKEARAAEAALAVEQQFDGKKQKLTEDFIQDCDSKPTPKSTDVTDGSENQAELSKAPFVEGISPTSTRDQTSAAPKPVSKPRIGSY